VTTAIDGPTLEENRRTTLIGYAIALVATAAAALGWWGAHALLMPEVSSAVSVAVFSAAVLVAASLGGTRPGIAATLLGALTLALLSSGPGHLFATLSPRDTATLIASTALSSAITFAVARFDAAHAALTRGLPEIERRSRDRANDAARRRIEEESRKSAEAAAEVADMQATLRQRSAAATTAAATRAGYLATTRQIVRLPLHVLDRYAARLRSSAGDALNPVQRRDLDGVELCQQHITSLVDTLLVPTAVESGLFLPNVASVSLSEVIARAAALVEPYLAARGSHLEQGSVDVPHGRADAAILTQVLARLVREEAASSSPCTLRLNAEERDGGVALECRRTRNGSLTMNNGSQELPAERERDEVDMAVLSSLDAAELTRRMGGTLTEGVSGAESRFTIWLSTKAPSSLVERSGPVTLWPPIAFELPRTPSRGAS